MSGTFVALTTTPSVHRPEVEMYRGTEKDTISGAFDLRYRER